MNLKAAQAKARGDAARYRRDWSGAVAQYRRHLQAKPTHFAIWVQLGHALKESRRLEEALEAYDTALRLRADDADLLLSIGQAHKLMGARRRAIQFFQRSAGVDGNLHAIAELAGLGSSRSIDSAATISAQQTQTLQRIAPYCDGLRPIGARDIVMEQQGDRMRLLTSDCWLMFEIDPERDLTSNLALLTIEIDDAHGPQAPGGQIHFDYGGGLEERYSLACPTSTGIAKAILAAPSLIKRIRWSPTTQQNVVAIPRVTLRAIKDSDEPAALIRAAAGEAVDFEAVLLTTADLLQRAPLGAHDAAEATLFLANPVVDNQYWRWCFLYDNPTIADYHNIKHITADLPYQPRLSIVMPTFNTDPALLCECLDSILAQTYANFEVCIADDCSASPDIVDILDGYAKRDDRVKFVRRTMRGHISAASNDALKLATGDFIVLIDHDDLIPDYCLFVVAWYLNKYPNASVLYSDEDKIDQEGIRFDPYFKGNFNKFLMYGHNMINHLGVYRRSLVEAVGGFRTGLEGSQDYDLFLRCYERGSDDAILHIPHLLYHWRMTAGSAASAPDQKSYALLAAHDAVNGHFERTGAPLRSVSGFTPGAMAVEPTRESAATVSIIVTSRPGERQSLRRCLNAILSAPHDDVEIVVINEGVSDPDTRTYLDDLAIRGVIKIAPSGRTGDCGLTTRQAALAASGEILCFLSGAAEVLSGDWLVRARSLLAVDDVGVVGGRAVNADGSLKHFGLILGGGPDGVAYPAHWGVDPADPGYFCKARLLQDFSAVSDDCLFVRKADYIQVGGLEPELAEAYGSVDLCLKIGAIGRRTVADPDILLADNGNGPSEGGSRRRWDMRFEREAKWMHDHWSAALAHDPYFSPNMALYGGRAGLASPPGVLPPWRWAIQPR